ncbi:DUF3301 domain-containing protein [Ramlibacter sp.]|uniref:DUF3301 domain-containing protein n=1 Tax=Ramlibacter sp. TaxID=1917967 RepID=UPI003D0F6616
MMRDALWLLVTVGAFAGLWNWSTSGRERVLAVVREVCRDLDLQSLDDSVVLRGVRPVWTAGGLRLGRTYRFEFTLDGRARQAGDVGLAGSQLAWVRVGHPQGDIHIDVDGMRAGRERQAR